MRKPELIPTIVTAIVFAVAMWLGIWQLQRLEEKKALLATIEAAQSQAPRELKTFSLAELEASEWHNVTTKGTFLHNKEIYAMPRYHKGLLGYAILTPLVIIDKKVMLTVLVNRGWVPPEHKDAATRAAGNVTGEVIVEGAIRRGFKQGKYTPDNRPDTNLWFWYDLPAIAAKLDLPLMPILIDAAAVRNADGSEIKDGPLPFPITINIRNDHQGYAITWFMIGFAAIGVFLAYYRERKP